eukprot:6472517-Amphidinium_carterae.1
MISGSATLGMKVLDCLFCTEKTNIIFCFGPLVDSKPQAIEAFSLPQATSVVPSHASCGYSLRCVLKRPYLPGGMLFSISCQDQPPRGLERGSLSVARAGLVTFVSLTHSQIADGADWA